MKIKAADYGAAKTTPTIASIVCGMIREAQPVACCLSMGYMVTGVKHERVNFSDSYGDGSWNVPRTVSESRNRAGRCTALVVEYSDGSKVRFTWSDARGYRYTAI